MSGPSTVLLDVALLNTAEFNPSVRTSDSAIAALREEIRKDGILNALHALHCPPKYRYLLVDGHRRLRCAHDLGIEKVEVKLHTDPKQNPAFLFCKLNKATRSIKSFEWMCTWYETEGLIVREKPPQILENIHLCLEFFRGRNGIRYLIDKKKSPSICHYIVTVRQILERFQRQLGPVPDNTTIGHWVADHNLQAKMGQLSVDQATVRQARKLYKRIRANKPIERHESFEELVA